MTLLISADGRLVFICMQSLVLPASQHLSIESSLFSELIPHHLPFPDLILRWKKRHPDCFDRRPRWKGHVHKQRGVAEGFCEDR